MTTGPQHYREAERLLTQADRWESNVVDDTESYDAINGARQAAQVHATLAGVAMRFEHSRGIHVDEWREVLDIPQPKPPGTVDGRPVPTLPNTGRH